MIEYLDRQFSEREIYSSLDRDVARWFKEKYGKFSPPQRYSVKLVSENKNVLISSPTGTGKTLSAFLGVIDRLVKYAKEDKLENRVYSIYISPLRALGNDIHRNLDEPLKEIAQLTGFKGIRHAVRTGDTTSYEKQKMNKYAPHILITTPESLALMLCAPKFKEKLKNIESVVIDEIHSLAENKRGTHLSLSLERLERVCGKPFTRIGLSATISPLSEIAHYLIGNKERCCKVVDVSHLKKKNLKVIAPERDPLKTTTIQSYEAMYKIVEKIVRENRTTLIFTNTRSGTESVVINLKRVFKDEFSEDEIVAHHSSLSKSQRLEVEENLKSGSVRVVVSSTSLELGIDVGSIDVVIQIGSPKSIARCLQRVGRAGHNLKSITKGYFICPDYDDLVEVAVMLKKSYEHKVDSIIMPQSALDVLAQHIVGLSVEERLNLDDVFSLVRQSYPYRDLTRRAFDSVIKFLEGDEELAAVKVYGKIWVDRESNIFGKRGKLARLIYMSNIGTIPDETKITVAVGRDKIGYVEEGFAEKLKRGDIFSLGGKSYRFISISGMRIKVEPAFGQQPTVPRWFSEQLPLSFDLATDIRNFREEIFTMLVERDDREILDRISSMPVDKKAAAIILRYFKDQYTYVKSFNKNFTFDRNSWLIEYYNSPKDGFKIIFHTLYGKRVNDAISRMLAFLIGKKVKKNIAISINDSGFMLHMPKKIYFDEQLLKNVNIEHILRESIEKSEILKRRFRHVSTRGLMVLKRYKGFHMSVGRQHMTSSSLLRVVKKEEAFPLLEEAYREIIEDYLDIANLREIINQINSGDIKSIKIEVDVPSPFAHNLVVSGAGDVVMASSKKDMIRDLYRRIYKIKAMNKS